MTSGDNCLLRLGPKGEMRVIHYDCDDFPDGTTTEFRYGANGEETVVVIEGS